MVIRIVPGSMRAAMLAYGMFESSRVDAGTWTTPVYVSGVTEDELQAARELLEPYGFTVEIERIT